MVGGVNDFHLGQVDVEVPKGHANRDFLEMLGVLGDNSGLDIDVCKLSAGRRHCGEQRLAGWVGRISVRVR